MSEHEHIMQRLDELEVLLLDLIGKKEPPKPEPEYINVDQAAELLGLSRQSVYNLTSKGGIPNIKRKGSKKLVFKRSDIVAWMEAGRRNVASFN